MPDLKQNTSYSPSVSPEEMLKKTKWLSASSGTRPTAPQQSAQQPTQTQAPAQAQGYFASPLSNSTGFDAAAYLKKLGPVTTQYGGSTKFEKFHPGVDIAAAQGTPLRALAKGTVVSTVTDKKSQDMSGFGNRVTVKDERGNTWQYSHLGNVNVKPGQIIDPSTVIGSVSNTGSSYSTSGGTGSHLDLRLMDAYKKYLDPFTYLQATSRKR